MRKESLMGIIAGFLGSGVESSKPRTATTQRLKLKSNWKQRPHRKKARRRKRVKKRK